MLWYKAWLETRWRFLVGLVLLMCSAAAAVLAYPRVVRELLPLVPSADLGGVVGGLIREQANLSRTYRGYVWAQWFRQDMAQTWTIFAVLLGTGGLLSQASRGGALYTLSMPASRTRLLGVRRWRAVDRIAHEGSHVSRVAVRRCRQHRQPGFLERRIARSHELLHA